MLKLSAAAAIMLADRALAGLTVAADEVIKAAGEVRAEAVSTEEWLQEHEQSLLGHLSRLNVDPASVPVIASVPAPTAVAGTPAAATSAAPEGVASSSEAAQAIQGAAAEPGHTNS